SGTVTLHDVARGTSQASFVTAPDALGYALARDRLLAYGPDWVQAYRVPMRRVGDAPPAGRLERVTLPVLPHLVASTGVYQDLAVALPDGRVEVIDATSGRGKAGWAQAVPRAPTAL